MTWDAMTEHEKEQALAQLMGWDALDVAAFSHEGGITQSYAAVRDIEQELERRGLQEEYLDALIDLAAPFMKNDRYDEWRPETYTALWSFLTAPLDVRCKAALRACVKDI